MITFCRFGAVMTAPKRQKVIIFRPTLRAAVGQWRGWKIEMSSPTVSIIAKIQKITPRPAASATRRGVGWGKAFAPHADSHFGWKSILNDPWATIFTL